MSKLLIALVLVFVSMDMTTKQRQWQRRTKLKSVGYKAVDYWLSTDPNHNCADLNFDGQINFYDYAVFLNISEM
jgi:hypothetical protein